MEMLEWLGEGRVGLVSWGGADLVEGGTTCAFDRSPGRWASLLFPFHRWIYGERKLTEVQSLGPGLTPRRWPSWDLDVYQWAAFSPSTAWGIWRLWSRVRTSAATVG